MRALVAMAVLVSVAGCQTAASEMTEAEIAQIEIEVLEVMDGVFEGFRHQDVYRTRFPGQSLA